MTPNENFMKDSQKSPIYENEKLQEKDLSPVAKFDLSNKKFTPFEDLKPLQERCSPNKFPSFSDKEDTNSEKSSSSINSNQSDTKNPEPLSMSSFTVKVSNSVKRKETMKFKSKAMKNIYTSNKTRTNNVSFSSKSQPRKVTGVGVKKQLNSSESINKEPKHINVINKARTRQQKEETKQLESKRENIRNNEQDIQNREEGTVEFTPENFLNIKIENNFRTLPDHENIEEKAQALPA